MNTEVAENIKLNNRLVNIATLILGSLIVGVWTISRFFSQPIKYDLVGQQLLARQWLDGSFGGSVSAPTNYVLKMIGLYMPAEILNLNPKLFLIISAIFVNVLTFTCLYIILRAILKYFKINAAGIFNVSMLWLATIAGSVFWIQFTNSRNLELVAGLALLYLGLLIYRNPTRRKALAFVLLGGVVFFADPMQLFITSFALGIYVLMDAFMHEESRKRTAGLIIGLIAGGYIVSSLLIFILHTVTHLVFFEVGSLSQAVAILQHIPSGMLEIAKNTLRLIGGTNETGLLSRIANVALVVGMMTLVVVSLVRKSLAKNIKQFVLFIVVVILTTYAAYVASGQPLSQNDTSRYLIILVPTFVLLFSLLDRTGVARIVRYLATLLAIGVVVVNIILLLHITFDHKDMRIVNEGALQSRYEYLRESGSVYGYASMDSAIGATYLFGQHSDKGLLPLSCGPEGLRKATLFFDRNVFVKTEKFAGVVPLILDGSSITNYPNVCTIELINKQLGKPVNSFVYNGDTVMLYDAAVLSGIGFSVASK